MCFEGMRALLIDQTFRADLMLWAFALNAAYFIAAVIAFLALLHSAQNRRIAGAELANDHSVISWECLSPILTP